MASKKKESWKTRKEGYSLHNFYTRHTDEKGHKRDLRVTVPPYIAGAITRLIESKDHPAWQTTGDFIVDAIAHRLHWVDEHGSSPDSLSLTLLAMDLAYAEEERQAEKEALHSLTVRLREADDDEGAALIELVHKHMARLPASSRAKVQEVLRPYEL